jgi:hypothetical protein
MFSVRYEVTARGKFRRSVFSLEQEINDLGLPHDAPLPEYAANPSGGGNSKLGPLLGFGKTPSLGAFTLPPSVCLFATLWVSDGNGDSGNT